VTNNSTFGGISDNGVIGVSPGTPALLPPPVDLSANPTSTTDTMFEDFLAPNGMDMAGDSLLLIPTGPGWAVVHTPGGAGCANHETFGAGCDGLVLDSNDPVCGTNWDLTTTGFNATSQFGFTFFAFGRQDPPIGLPALGFPAPGCDDNLPLGAIFANLIGGVVGGSTTVSVSIPGGTAFSGTQMTAQTIGLTTTNPSGLATSNGLEGTFGK